MSDNERNLPPVDAQAELSERDRVEVARAAERANLEAAILRFNTNYNPSGGPQGGARPKYSMVPFISSLLDKGRELGV